MSSVGYGGILSSLKIDRDSQTIDFDVNLADCFSGRLEDTLSYSSKTVKLSPIIDVPPTSPSFSATGMLIEFSYQLRMTLILSNKQSESFIVPLHLVNKASSPEVLESRLESLRIKHGFFCPQEMPGSHFTESSII